jgi:hypothetical protein
MEIKFFKEWRQKRKTKLTESRREALLRLGIPEIYRDPINFMRENCAVYEPSNYLGDGTGPAYPIYLIYDNPKTLEGLKKLSTEDRRSNQELIEWAKASSKRQLDSINKILPRGSDESLQRVLTDAVLAYRITNNRTIRHYLLSGGIIGKTFVDWRDPQFPYSVKELVAENDHLSILTNYSSPDWRTCRAINDELLTHRELK